MANYLTRDGQDTAELNIAEGAVSVRVNTAQGEVLVFNFKNLNAMVVPMQPTPLGATPNVVVILPNRKTYEMGVSVFTKILSLARWVLYQLKKDEGHLPLRERQASKAIEDMQFADRRLM